MRFDVTVPNPDSQAEKHQAVTKDKVAELVAHAATHGLRLHIRPTTALPDHAPEGDQA